jgi:hypothetical protein
MAETEEEKTPLQQKLDEFSEQLSKVCTQCDRRTGSALLNLQILPTNFLFSGDFSYLCGCLAYQYWSF